MREPLDDAPYPQDSRSRPLVIGVESGTYVVVQDEKGVVYVLPDGPHRHPKVLGGARPAMYAGDLTVESDIIKDVTNLSGTFQFDDPDGLLSVADKLRELGFTVANGAVRLFPSDGSRPIVLQ